MQLYTITSSQHLLPPPVSLLEKRAKSDDVRCTEIDTKDSRSMMMIGMAYIQYYMKRS